MRTHWMRAPAWLVPLSMLVGCGGGSAVVLRRPDWPYQHYERLAVVAARPSDPSAAGDARLLADRLTTLLAQSGAFTVLSRAELRAVFAEQDLSRLADAVDEGTALPEGQLEIAQALVVPKITRHELIAHRETRRIPRYVYDRHGRRVLDRRGRPVQSGWETINFFTHAAQVGATVRVVDAVTGEILLSHSTAPIRAEKTTRGRPPSVTPEELAESAVQQLAVDFFKRIAPTRMKVKLDKDMLILATDYFDGKYDELKSPSPRMSEFLLVVRDLPAACDRNDFRVALATEDGRHNLWEEEFTWSGTAGRRGFAYAVPVPLLVESGAEKFVAKLYSAGSEEPVLKRNFKLKVAKNNGDADDD